MANSRKLNNTRTNDNVRLEINQGGGSNGEEEEAVGKRLSDYRCGRRQRDPVQERELKGVDSAPALVRSRSLPPEVLEPRR